MVLSLYWKRKKALARSSSGMSFTRCCTMSYTSVLYCRHSAARSFSGKMEDSRSIQLLSVSMQSYSHLFADTATAQKPAVCSFSPSAGFIAL